MNAAERVIEFLKRYAELRGSDSDVIIRNGDPRDEVELRVSDLHELLAESTEARVLRAALQRILHEATHVEPYDESRDPSKQFHYDGRVATHVHTGPDKAYVLVRGAKEKCQDCK